MPNSRAVMLWRRLSPADNKLKSLNLGQNSTKESVISPNIHTCDFKLSRRFTTLTFNPLPVPQLKRSLSNSSIKMTSEKSNFLIREKSPYLLQHAHNPVQWYPWGQAAIDRARAENKLIFLSIGYSTCHWCHVMEKESFENEDIAKILNKHFVSVKVDREERPDLDRVYMMFVVASTGSGGWPMSVFLTPELLPITGGTYFPPEDRWGKPGFKSILMTLAKKWKYQEIRLTEAGENIMDALRKISVSETGSSTSVPDELTWNACFKSYVDSFEPEFGGFGFAPKFPQASIFNFLFHYYARDKFHSRGKKSLEICQHSLKNIAKGGIRDHIGGGFARYAVDNKWQVPHFEKMLYDQAQLMIVFTDAYLATKNDFYSEVVRDIIDYVNRDLRHTTGGYFSAEDADSFPRVGSRRKREGAFYTWKYDELETLLRDEKIKTYPYLQIFCDYFNVKHDGNIPPEYDPHSELAKRNVLCVFGSKKKTAKKFGLTVEEVDEVITECIEVLYEAREKRPRPQLDTKMLCSWNGLMISGLSKAGQGLNEKEFIDFAIEAAEFIKIYLHDPVTNSLTHSCYKGDDGSIVLSDKPVKAFLDDYAFLIKGLLDLYEASFDSAWFKWARELQEVQNQLFWDYKEGGYFTSADDDKTVLLRVKAEQDGAEPSGNSISCHNLLRLAAYADKSSTSSGGQKETAMAKQILVYFGDKLRDNPTALPEMMSALMFYTDSPTQVVIAGGSADPRTLELVRAVRARLLPGRVLAVADPELPGPPVLNRAGLTVNDQPTAYVCRRYACSLPVTDVKQLETLLDEGPTPRK